MENDPEKLDQEIEKSTINENEEEVKIKPLPKEKLDGAVRTYATDIAEMMRREKGSIIKIALAEQTRREKYQQKKDPTATKNVIVMMLGFFLIVGGIMIFVYTIVNRSKPVNVVNTMGVLPSLFFTENQVQIDMSGLNRGDLYNAITTQVNNPTLVPGTINNLFVSYNSTTGQMQTPATMFLQKLSIATPEILFKNIYPQFMLGVYANEPKNNLFLVFRVKDFNESFNGMRDWEYTMLTDLLKLFRIDTRSAGKTIFNKSFETTTLVNKEARVLKDDEGNILLSYIFLDSKTIMITTQPVAVDEVLKRINLQTLR